MASKTKTAAQDLSRIERLILRAYTTMVRKYTDLQYLEPHKISFESERGVTYLWFRFAPSINTSEVLNCYGLADYILNGIEQVVADTDCPRVELRVTVDGYYGELFARSS
ncbi:MAG: hypothetical protein GF309_02210 [Candidatus Lokiarchaeota archaeon]|nr:hypothetical protein [Candidatus Lokiarchaeota archaeon]